MYNPKDDPRHCTNCGKEPGVSRLTLIPKFLFVASLFVLVASLLPRPSDQMTDHINLRVAIAFFGSSVGTVVFGSLWAVTTRCRQCKTWFPRGLNS